MIRANKMIMMKIKGDSGKNEDDNCHNEKMIKIMIITFLQAHSRQERGLEGRILLGYQRIGGLFSNTATDGGRRVHTNRNGIRESLTYLG